MNYVISDIHNDCDRLKRLLKLIDFGAGDHLYVLGDLFDRCDYAPDPVGVYFCILSLGARCTVVPGNHDKKLRDYILDYYSCKEGRRKKKAPYKYNSFALLSERLPETDMVSLAEWIGRLPLQCGAEAGGKRFLLAHAMTSLPGIEREPDYYLCGEGGGAGDSFYKEGVPGYISVCGHLESGFFKEYGGNYLTPADHSVWKNDAGNLYMIDCGCGYRDGRLGCLCLETGECWYVE